MPVTVTSHIEQWAIKEPFRIAGYSFTELDIAVTEVSDGCFNGVGEACGVYYKKDTAQNIKDTLDAFVSGQHCKNISRSAIQDILPANGARNALDAALWDLEAKQTGLPVWELAKLNRPKPLITAFTIGAGDPADMAETAKGIPQAMLIKLKLTGEPVDAERLLAVRAARPDVDIAVDGNQGFTDSSLDKLMPALVQAQIILLEQPFPIGDERRMSDFDFPFSTAADESVQIIGDIEPLTGLFDVINIKLDKCGGLSHGLEMARYAKKLGFKVMVGNMGGTSRSQAPAYILGQVCDFVDLDGPTLLKTDRAPSADYADGMINCGEDVWGAP